MRIKFIILTATALLLTACSETKYVAEDEYLLNKVLVRSDVKSRDINTAELKQFVRQHGNARWFSAVKIPLYTYSLSGRDTTRWLNRTLRAIGEAPVIYDSALTRQSMQNILLQVRNKGFLQAQVDVYHKTKGRKLNTLYMVHPGHAYTIRNVSYDIQDSAIAAILQMDNPRNHGLAKGMTFNVDNLDAERRRITTLLTNRGYYRFNKEYITYRADSVAGTTEVDLTLVLHRFRNSQVTDLPHQPYTIRQVSYHSGNADDTTLHLRPKVLSSNTYIRQGGLYSFADLQSTYNHFGRLGAVRYTNIAFREVPDTTLLDCDISISTNKPSTISFQPEGTNTAGDLGAAASLTYLNRNLFRGSETFSVELRGAYEAISGLEGYSNSNFLEYSLQAKLSFPRFLAPFLSRSFRRRINATSEVSMLYDLQNRPEFLRRVFSVGWRYNWNDPRHHDRYQIDLLDLNFITMPWISDKFRHDYLEDTSQRNALLLYNYQDLFIMRTGFRYTYNNGRYAIKTNLESSGNLLSLMAHTLGFHKNADGNYTFLDVAFAQYVKGDIDFTRNFQLDYDNQLVFHVGLGVAYPYGNSNMLPFEKTYFSGGANSLRGWSVRSIGPGSFANENGQYNFLMHTGDLKLDLNLEYRAHLFWKLGGALFVDAGNIWNIRDYDNQPGGQFRLSEFWRQLAVSYGIGFRFNFDYFILRFDMGMKAVNPVYQTRREHFPIAYPKLSRDFAFHFAVGLPF
ncbi:MAG: BamA/TamA family outer membrane protein [Prevotella sp.]|nr:BamA/TamA family outer membrane protein [Prevotella sp.]